MSGPGSARSSAPTPRREFFHVAVALENPRNIWGLDRPPGSWSILAGSQTDEHNPGLPESGTVPSTLVTSLDRFVGPDDEHSPRFWLRSRIPGIGLRRTETPFSGN